MEAEARPEEPSTLQNLRNMWQFANLAQYISLFGEAVRIDKDLDIEVRPACAQRRHTCAAPADAASMADTHRNWNPSACSPIHPRNSPKSASPC